MTGDPDAALGNHLRMLRVGRGWSQLTLSLKANVGIATIVSIENNSPPGRQRNANVLSGLSRALGLPDDYLAKYRDNAPEDPKEKLVSQSQAGAGAGVAGDSRDAALGRHLRMLRAERRWTQETLREKSGVSEGTIRAIESNYPYPHRDTTLIILSRSLGLPGNYLIDYRDNPPGEKPATRTKAEIASPAQIGATDATPQERPASEGHAGIAGTARRPSMFDLIMQRLQIIEEKLDLLIRIHYPETPESTFEHHEKPG